MPTFKCKMCGGQLNLVDNDAKIIQCDYCGTTQTLPTFDNEKKRNLFNRANNLRLNQEFDKAAGVYESIVAEFPNEAEAYWGLCLCRYGIEYVDDPKTGKKIPTCRRTLTTSILNDRDFEATCKNADILSNKIYRKEAEEIDQLQKQILEIVSQEDPYDIFICYKETDDDTKARTEDSAIAQDLYTELVREGYRVFFARVTLRDKAGAEYEPYIYAALSSARVMLVVGTKPEYFDAVWVKNEWARYLGMLQSDSQKRLIVCYRDMNAYDMPPELSRIQALNISEVTFFKNLTSVITEWLPKKNAVSDNHTQYAVDGSPSLAQIDSLLKRMEIFLADGEWKRAEEYAERILDINPECSTAYIGVLLSNLRRHSIAELETLDSSLLTEKSTWTKAKQYANEEELALYRKTEWKNLIAWQYAEDTRNLNRIRKNIAEHYGNGDFFRKNITEINSFDRLYECVRDVLTTDALSQNINCTSHCLNVFCDTFYEDEPEKCQELKTAVYDTILKECQTALEVHENTGSVMRVRNCKDRIKIIPADYSSVVPELTQRIEEITAADDRRIENERQLQARIKEKEKLEEEERQRREAAQQEWIAKNAETKEKIISHLPTAAYIALAIGILGIVYVSCNMLLRWAYVDFGQVFEENYRYLLLIEICIVPGMSLYAYRSRTSIVVSIGSGIFSSFIALLVLSFVTWILVILVLLVGGDPAEDFFRTISYYNLS